MLVFINSGIQLMSQSQFEVKAKKEVSGFILDKTTQNPVEFATVSVFQISDLSLVGGAISNQKEDSIWRYLLENMNYKFSF